ncbi:Protein of unknown function (DUF3696)/AAA domain [Actinobacteria bacterium IMCC26256]|nr:Protein of unknown function (DUF3696)/AAA domain [Actinobacteria bacterium IMCC26256]
MLTELVIENFKAFGERQVIPLAPITLIFGSNSAGKSSIIQSLLLMKQSNFAAGELSIRGEFADLGSFRALIHRHDETLALTLGAAAALGEQDYAGTDHPSKYLPGPNRGACYEVSFGLGDENVGRRDVVEWQSVRLSSNGQVINLQRLELVFHNPEEDVWVPLAQTFLLSEVDTMTLLEWALRGERGLDPTAILGETNLAPKACAVLSSNVVLPYEVEDFHDGDSGYAGFYKQFEPESRFSESGRRRAEQIEQIRKAMALLSELEEEIGLEAPEEFLSLAPAREFIENVLGLPASETLQLDRSSLVRQFKGLIEELANLSSMEMFSDSLEPARDGVAYDIDKFLHNSHHALRSSLQRLRYLGPMRDSTDRISIVTGQVASEVGARGENLVALLLQQPETLVQVNHWLLSLEIPYELEIRALHDEGLSLAIGDVFCLLLKDVRTGVFVSASDVGFGISQILPVVVASLTTAGPLCIEQPEIHLHPGLQARMGDLFAQAYLDGVKNRQHRQFILETHSEHLVLRMQRLIRRGTLKPEDVCVLHVGFDDGGRSVVKRLEIDSLGDFSTDWPGGFFDERLDEVFGD